MSETSGMSNLRPASQSGPIGVGKPWPIDIEAAAESVRLARESLARMRRDGGYGDETWGPMTCLLAGAVNEVAALRAELASLRARLASAEHALTTIATQGEPDTETGGQSGPGGDRPVDVARAALAAMEIEGDGAGDGEGLRERLAKAEAERDEALWAAQKGARTAAHFRARLHDEIVGRLAETEGVGVEKANQLADARVAASYGAFVAANPELFATVGLAPAADAPATTGAGGRDINDEGGGE